MPEIGTSSSMSGDGKRSDGLRPQATAPILDSTRLCEKAKTLDRHRTSHSFNTASGVHTASAFNFEIEFKNIILVPLRVFEFSHSLGQ
jgi:hypothetical protein